LATDFHLRGLTSFKDQRVNKACAKAKDHGISGAKGRDKRPAFDALCRAASRRRFDIVMAWSVDRLGRSLQDLVNFLSELHALKVDLFLKTQGIDTTTPSGKAMFGMLSVFADFERSIIQERVRAGLVRARREGKRLGRPPTIKGVLKQRIAAALKAPGRTEGVRKIAKKFGVNDLRAYDSVSDARASLGRYLDFYNSRRPHSSLDGMTPDQAYLSPLPLRLAA
jgi:DNA invertase Pin-like site-specific DNA recombinase